MALKYGNRWVDRVLTCFSSRPIKPIELFVLISGHRDPLSGHTSKYNEKMLRLGTSANLKCFHIYRLYSVAMVNCCYQLEMFARVAIDCFR